MKRNRLSRRLGALALAAVMTVSSVLPAQAAELDALQLQTVGVTETLKASSVANADLVISTSSQLKSFATNVNAGTSYEGKVVKLACDIAVNGEFTPIGNYLSTFAGVFDGCGYTISGIIVADTSGLGAGLFGANSGTVKNVTVKGATITTGYGNAGGIVGYNFGTVMNCQCLDTTIEAGGGSSVGGIVGNLGNSEASVLNCFSNADVTGGCYVGGIVGCANSGMICNSANTGDVNATIYIAAGILGFSASCATLKNCYNAGNITASEEYAAGIAACASGSKFFNCYTVESEDVSEFANASNYAYNCGSFTASVMKSQEFVTTLNNNLDTDEGTWLSWEIRSGSSYPMLQSLVNIQEACSVSVSQKEIVYSGKAKKPSVTVKYGSTKLVKGTDYEVSYSNNVNAGTASVVVTGLGRYVDGVTKTFTIEKADQVLSCKKTYTKTYGSKSFTVKVNQKTGNGKLTFSSSNKNVVKVNKTTGKVTIKGTGTAKITVKAAGTNNYNKATKVITIKVKKK